MQKIKLEEIKEIARQITPPMAIHELEGVLASQRLWGWDYSDDNHILADKILLAILYKEGYTEIVKLWLAVGKGFDDPRN